MLPVDSRGCYNHGSQRGTHFACDAKLSLRSTTLQFDATEAVLLLLATIGPLKVTVVCAAISAKASDAFLKQVAFRSVLIAGAVCVMFALIGEAILKVFHVSVPAFQIGGGIIVLLFSLDTVLGQDRKDASENGTPGELEQRAQEIAAYPLAIPLMASVSGLVSITSLIAQSKNLTAILFVATAVFVIMGLNYVCLRSCRFLVYIVGPTALQVVGKLMGVILAALAVELILMGLNGLGLRLER
jgi:multiple antibiotic resistance protein